MIDAEFSHLSNEKIVYYLQQALNANESCVRASLLEGQFNQRQGKLKQAIRAYQRVKKQNIKYISETIFLISQCYEKRDDQLGLMDYLYQCLNENPCLAIILLIADKLQQWQSEKIAADFLADQLKQHPSLTGVEYLLEILLAQATSQNKADLLLIQNLLRHAFKKKVHYQCEHCGFETKTLDWLCPSCKLWETIKPYNLTGENHHVS
ncbi:MAG: hypothetical protein JKY13_00920 [Gammaproteobacteria bacterium]|nr:hypothetical protein [Gammaproteobacteria bacterium]